MVALCNAEEGCFHPNMTPALLCVCSKPPTGIRKVNSHSCSPDTGESLLIKMTEMQFSNAESDINDI